MTIAALIAVKPTKIVKKCTVWGATRLLWDVVEEGAVNDPICYRRGRASRLH